MAPESESPFHEGEIAVQERAGAREMATRIGTGIHGAIPDRFLPFLAERSFVAVAARDAGGRLWASPLFGSPGFLRVLDPRTLRIEAGFAAGDPLASAPAAGDAIGVLAIDFASRRRLRLNGSVRLADGAIELALREVFPNCPKYIHASEAIEPVAGAADARTTRAHALSAEAASRIAAADTFFVATAHPRAGADVSHRGGAPGFVHVIGDRRLAWPDYSGNFMFQTLGNLATSPAAALLFVDFESGHVLHLSGRATVDWDPRRRLAFPGAERVVDFAVEEIVERPGGAPLRMRLTERSPHTPR